MGKPTPGPWVFHPDARGDESSPSITFEHEDLGTTPVFCGGPFWSNGDGRLAASAPDLLEALREAERTLNECTHSTDARGGPEDPGLPNVRRDAIRRARAAIAKAEGR